MKPVESSCSGYEGFIVPLKPNKAPVLTLQNL